MRAAARGAVAGGEAVAGGGAFGASSAHTRLSMPRR